MHLHGTLSETAGSPGRYAGHSSGHVRRPIIDRAGGSVHQEVVIAELEPGGSVERHLHAFEEAFYVLEGALVLEAAGATEQLAADDYVFVDRGVAHALRNDSGAPVRWLEASAPQPGAALEDTVFADGPRAARGARGPVLAGSLRRGRAAAAERRDPRRLRRRQRRRRRAQDPRRARHRRDPAQPHGRAVRAPAASSTRTTTRSRRASSSSRARSRPTSTATSTRCARATTAGAPSATCMR